MKPWVKWHRARSQRFDALPVHARGLLAELLAHTDDDGWIRLGTDDRGALWRFIGAHPKERRTLAKHLDTLEQIGAVETAEEGWRLPSFDRYQAPDRGPAKSTERTRSVHGDDTERARKRHGNEAKSSKSLNTGPGDRDTEGEREEETEEVVHSSYPEGARETGPQPARPPAVSTDFDRYRLAFVRAYGRAFEERASDMWTASAHEQHIRTVVAWALDYRTRLPEAQRDPDRLMGRLVAGYFAAKTSPRPPVKWLAEDPGRYLERSQPRRESAPVEVTWGTTERAPESVAVEPVADLDGLLAGLLRPLATAERLHPMARVERSRESEEERRRMLARQAEALRASMEAAE